jgi:sialic acid synthase SpsE
MQLEIAGRHVGAGLPLFTIAELGLNHGGSVNRAIAMVDAAWRAGASAIKLQTLDASRLVTAAAPAPAHVNASSMIDFFRAFELDRAEHELVRARTHSRDMAFVSTPLHEQAIDLLEAVGCDAYKIASGDITHDRLIRRAARTAKPLLVSTGMSDTDEIGAALEWARTGGAREIVLLHCVSAYPVPEGADNLCAIRDLARRFGVAVGLSDHATVQPGRPMLAAALAVALGACVYERHLSLGSTFDEIDAGVSSTEDELAAAILNAEQARTAIGAGGKRCLSDEVVNLKASRRGLYAARRLRAGYVVRPEDIVALRPANGLAPCDWTRLAGIALRRTIEAGAAFEEDDCSPRRIDRSVAHVA